MTVEEYLSLITSAYDQKPKFTAMISADLSPSVQVQNLLEEMVPRFDLDLAIGDQLDIIGKWVGITRNVFVPIEDVFFSWDDVDATGWDYGIWQSDPPQGAVTVLPDDVYRTLIRAKIAANNWDGTTEGAYDIWEALFPTITILIQDNQNMSYGLAFVGGIIDSLTLALIIGGYIPLKPEGVRVNTYYIPVDSGPVFAWDLVETDLVAGWDTGSWTEEYTPT